MHDFSPLPMPMVIGVRQRLNVERADFHRRIVANADNAAVVIWASVRSTQNVAELVAGERPTVRGGRVGIGPWGIVRLVKAAIMDAK